MTDPRARVRRVADAVEASWASAAGGSDVGPCVGVLAALALLGRRDADGPDPAEQIIGSSDEEIAQLLMEVWCLFTIARPELAFRCGPFAEWLNPEPPDPQLVGAAAAVARAAVKAGVLELTLDLDVAREIDLLGPVYTQMQSQGGRRAWGEFYTPPEVAELMAAMVVAGPGSSVCDPAAGTGGLFRAAAQRLRAEGRDPHEVRWFGCDVSRIAVAGLAVNAHIWGLGPQIVIACANSLTEPDWQVRALREQQAAIDAQESRMKASTLLVAVQLLTGGDGS
jgi:N-6 DNA Methylase